MGCSNSRPSIFIECGNVDESYTGSRYWFRVPSELEAMSGCTDVDLEASNSRERIRPTVERSLLELRALLDYPIARHLLLGHSKTAPPCVETGLLGWLDIQAFNSLSGDDIERKRVMAHSINKRYVQDSPLLRPPLQLQLDEVINHPEKIVSGVFDEVQSLFLGVVHNQFFVQFRTTVDYGRMCSTLRKKYNRVKQNDFCYHQLIGQGGFGLVAEVSKKSTGARYAMKLQRKDQMAELFRSEPWRINTEKHIISNCHHPFIVELFFAFQTESLLAMVTGLGTGRDLSKVLKAGGPLTVEQVRFYAAEVTSALSYLHHKGIVYRDLKPANILLDLDGHIRLIDFGGATDLSGDAHNVHIASPLIFLPKDSESESSSAYPISHYWSDVLVTSRQKISGRAEHTGCGSVHSTASDGSAGSVRDPACPDSDPECACIVELMECDDAQRMLREQEEGGRRSLRVTAAAVRRLQKQFREANLSAPDALCQLCACDGDFNRAVERLEETVSWRQGFVNFAAAPDHQSLAGGCVFYCHGTDSQGHPLLVFNSRYLRPLAGPDAGATERSEGRDNPAFLQWVLTVMDAAIRQLPPNVLQVTLLVNRAGARKRVDWELVRFFFSKLNRHFPSRIHTVIFYPANLALRAAVGIFKSVMGRLQSCKVVSDLDMLRELIPDQHIPADVGGSSTYEFDPADFPAPAACKTSAPGEPHTASDASGEPAASAASTVTDHEQLSPAVSATRSEDAPACRARSIVGSYSYMAPEMVIMMVPVRGYTHTGYTKAVDWWGLGVTMYRLLAGAYPFKTDIPKPMTPEDIITEGSDRYSALLEKVDYSPISKHSDVTDFISQLLLVDDQARLGYGPEGAINVSKHPFFRDINWVELEQKKSRPPPLPPVVAPLADSPYTLTLDGMLRGFGKEDWVGVGGSGIVASQTLEQQRLDGLNAHLEYWEYASPAVVLQELQVSGCT